ncbi:MAG: hypothetical protein JWO41_533 [Candidatus Saccharibacteria bacterium]|nr:hypothetical protein [Candidatus Saccharibacteria bacterium]
MEFGSTDRRFEVAAAEEAALITVLEAFDDHEFLKFTPNGLDLYRNERIGTQTKSFSIGNVQHTMDAGTYEPVLVGQYPSLHDFIASHHKNPEPDTHQPLTQTNESAKAWEQTLPTIDNMRDAAVAEIETRQTNFHYEVVMCGACDGESATIHECNCMQHGSTYEDILSGVVVETVETGAPDSDCKSCCGTGLAATECRSCLGAGFINLYPEVRLLNIATNESIILSLDLAHIIAAGELVLGGHLVDTKGYLESCYELFSDVHGYLVRELEKLGVSAEDSIRVLGKKLQALDFHDAEMTIAQAEWRQLPDGTTESSTISEENIIDGLRQAQVQLAGFFAKPVITLEHYRFDPAAARVTAAKLGQVMTDGAVVEETTFAARPARRLHEAFNDLVALAASKGYTLGYDQSPLNGHDVGPAFHVFDQNGQYKQALYVASHLQTALENSWFELLELNDNS